MLRLDEPIPGYDPKETGRQIAEEALADALAAVPARPRTHHENCWRDPHHQECAVAMIERWLPVIEAAKEWFLARKDAASDHITQETAEVLESWEDTLFERIAAALKREGEDHA